MGRTPAGQTRERVFQFVRDRLLAGQPPTVREVQEAFGFRSVQSAREHLEALVAAGRLVKQPGKARGYRLANPSEAPGGTARAAAPPRLIPLLGRVAAGSFALAVEDLEGHLPVQAARAGDESELFGLRVHGESMRDAGILPGDIVIVRRQPSADDGAIVVALVGEEATIKRLHRRGGRIELHPANPDYQVLRPDPAELQVLGRVIEVRRYLD
ncbi:transcriptional repressor LexA [Thiococcus pfennigii]|jgi:repressor LexA|uniref:transcriptional repressor LexA n=1 Tax=Thiococcus pfennigii TaxID=1057 RepID=UPI0019087F93|nr:transcriptional repressor LexA [Thiococcus pfennigii]MBK1700076.1 repressor LexA [Thiococcus pfennigii]MBK1730786.1 repressor LexA [Thiococcus pfennigii]